MAVIINVAMIAWLCLWLTVPAQAFISNPQQGEKWRCTHSAVRAFHR